MDAGTKRRLLLSLKTGGVAGWLLFSALMEDGLPLVPLRLAGAVAAGTAAVFALLTLLKRGDREPQSPGAVRVFLSQLGRILWAGVRWAAVLNAAFFLLMRLMGDPISQDSFPLGMLVFWVLLEPIPLMGFLLWRGWCLIAKEPDPDLDDFKAGLFLFPGLLWDLLISLGGLVFSGSDDSDSGFGSSGGSHSSHHSSSSGSSRSGGGFGGGSSRGGGGGRHF